MAASRVLLGEMAGKVGWIMMRGHYGMDWAEYEDRRARKRLYEEREWMRDLERRKLIRTKRIGEKLMVRLTEKGWQQALRDRIKTTSKDHKGGNCIAIFDVPESERRVRDALRRMLSECGFTMVQRSVWMSGKDVLEPLCALLQGAHLDQWVRIIVGSEVTRLLPARMVIAAKEYAKKKNR